ncbi:uncharacterized protein LOC116166912 [Photinus pyralis]|uniref:uncharacterized protein LOC116166912 n=1 Tax=Photinus pyralis TaxID=7054 RepID=UPI00126763DA|nr:uncharacterized protein LOC116166912 [Photinus pyralis]
MLRSGIEEPPCERNALLHEINSICEENNYNLRETGKRTPSKGAQLTELAKKIRDECAASFSAENQVFQCGEDVLASNDQLPFVDHNYGTVAQTITIAGDDLQEIDENIPPNSEAMEKPQSLRGTAQTSNQETSSVSKNKQIIGPTRRRLNKAQPLRKNALGYLTEKNEKEYILKTKELELQHRKIAVEERKVAVEERKLEIEERKILLENKRLDFDHQERMERLEIEKNNYKIELEQKKITNQLLVSQQNLIDNLLKK